MEPGVDVYRYTMDQIRLADDAGFETSWFAEHHFSNYGLCPNPFLPIVKAAAITERIRFGQAITVLPIWHPVRLVEDINVTDILCEGRLNVGFGRGYQPAEFAALGVDIEDSKSMFDEAVELMTKAWTEEDFTFAGEHWQVPDPLTILPKPVQAPHPPLFIAASSPTTFVKAAEEGYGVLSSGAGLTLEQVGTPTTGSPPLSTTSASSATAESSIRCDSCTSQTATKQRRDTSQPVDGTAGWPRRFATAPTTSNGDGPPTWQAPASPMTRPGLHASSSAHPKP